MQRFLSTFLSFGVMHAAQLFLPLLALPYLSRVLLPDAFGLLLFMLNFGVITQTVLDWSFSLTATRVIASCRESRETVSFFFINVLLAKTLLVALLSILVILGGLLIPQLRNHIELFFLAVCYGICMGFNPTFFFQGVGKGIEKMAVLDFVGSCFVLGMTFLLVRTPEDAWLYPALLVCGKGSAYLWQIRNIFVEYGAPRPRIRAALEIIRHGNVLFSGRLAGLLYTSGNIFLIGQLLTPAQTGKFIAAEKIIRAVIGLTDPVVRTLFPEICRSVNKGGDVNRMQTISIGGIMGSMFFLAVLVYCFAGEIVWIVFGQEFMEVLPLLRTLCLLIPLLSANIFLGTQCIVAYGQDASMARIQWVGAFLSLPTTTVLTLYFSLNGAIWTSLFVESVIFAQIAALLLWRVQTKKTL